MNLLLIPLLPPPVIPLLPSLLNPLLSPPVLPLLPLVQ